LRTAPVRPKLGSGAGTAPGRENNNENNEIDPPRAAWRGVRGLGRYHPHQASQCCRRVRIQAWRHTPDNHPLTIRLTEAAKAIGAQSSGRLNVTVFPNSQLRGDPEMLSQLRSGGIELLAAPSLTLSTLVPLSGLPSIGFAFGSYNQVWAAMDGGVGDVVRNAIGKAGIVPMPLAQVSTGKLYEVQKYCALSNHCWSGYWIIANRRALTGLPADLLEIVNSNFDAAAAKERADLLEMDRSLQAELTGKSMIFNKPVPCSSGRRW
jgi:TRAP-type C4-dicarboxylate transport system substrate-binding protein